MTQLGVFAKYWQPGAVKTRLGKDIGHERASGLYRAFLAATCRRFAAVGDRRVLTGTPAERRADFEELAGPAWEVEIQSMGDLGCRMRDHFAAAFANDADRVLLIGSDTPTLPLDVVEQAFDLLEEYRVVLGPADDGGYYLIGASGSVPPVFSNVAWSSPDVWNQTVRLLDEAGCPFGTLRNWYDVDDHRTLIRLRNELEDAAGLDQSLAELRDAICLILA